MLPLFAAACGDDDKIGTGDAAAVFPEQGFIGRTTRVAVIGDRTTWDATTTVSFGDGATVSNIELAGPSALFVDVAVDPARAAGALDVTVTDNGDTSTLAGAFTVASPIAVEELIPVSQGSLGLYSITNLDLLHPFDLTADEETGAFTALDVALGDTGVGGFIAQATEGEIIVQVSADVAATAGALTVTSGDEVSLGGEVAVAARTPIVFVPGKPTTATLGADGVALYEVTLTDDAVINLSVLFDNKDADLAYSILGADGKWTTPGGGAFSTSSEFINTPGQKFYISLLDFAGVGAFEYTLSAEVGRDLTGVTKTAEVEPNDTSAAATAGAAGTTVVFQADLASVDDADFFTVIVPANRVMTIHTTTGLTGMDTVVSVLNPDGTTFVKDDADEDLDAVDIDTPETVTTATLTAGTYFIKIENSAFGVFLLGAPASGSYDVIVDIAAP